MPADVVRCTSARRALSAVHDGEPGAVLPAEHLAACPACAAHRARLDEIRRSLRFEVVDEIPDLAGAVARRLAAASPAPAGPAPAPAPERAPRPAPAVRRHPGRRRAVLRRPLRTAVAAAFVVGLVVGGAVVAAGPTGRADRPRRPGPASVRGRAGRPRPAVGDAHRGGARLEPGGARPTLHRHAALRLARDAGPAPHRRDGLPAGTVGAATTSTSSSTGPSRGRAARPAARPPRSRPATWSTAGTAPGRPTRAGDGRPAAVRRRRRLPPGGRRPARPPRPRAARAGLHRRRRRRPGAGADRRRPHRLRRAHDRGGHGARCSTGCARRATGGPSTPTDPVEAVLDQRDARPARGGGHGRRRPRPGPLGRRARLRRPLRAPSCSPCASTTSW